jgi:anti-sigma factor RsiW
MRCQYVKQKLDRYIQGDLPESMSKRVERHLNKCRDSEVVEVIYDTRYARYRKAYENDS